MSYRYHVALTMIVTDDDYSPLSWWLNGRIAGRMFSFDLPLWVWRGKRGWILG